MPRVVQAQRRWRKSYRYWEDQVKTSLPQARAVASPRFTLSPEDRRRKANGSTYVDTAAIERRSAYYANTDLKSALQMVQAKDLPSIDPDCLRGVEEYTHDALNVSQGLAPKHSKLDPEKAPAELSREELLTQLRGMANLDKASKQLAESTLDAAATSGTARDHLLKKVQETTVSEDVKQVLGRIRMPGLPTEVASKLRDREDFYRMPTMEDAKGSTPEERLEHYYSLMDSWSEKERITDDLYVSKIRKNREKGAPQTERWTARDEDAYSAARLQHFRDMTNVPGVRYDNITSVLSAAKSGKPMGNFNVDSLRGPTWQL